MPTEYLLLEEVAREARVVLRTVRYWVWTKKLRSVRPGRRRMVRREDLDAFLSSETCVKPLREMKGSWAKKAAVEAPQTAVSSSEQSVTA